MSESVNQAGSSLNSQEEVLAKFNEHLQNMNIKHRWSSLEEISVHNQFNWQSVIKSKEVLQAILWILVANLRIGLIPFLANNIVLYITIIYYTILHFYIIYEEYTQKQPSLPGLLQSLLKEIAMLAIVVLGLENYYLGLPLPPFIKNYSGIFFMGLLFLKVNSFSDLSLVIKLASKIVISGKDWKLNRLVMMNPKAVKLNEYFIEMHRKALNIKKNK